MSTLYPIFDSAGLGLDIIGAALIFRFGLPQPLSRTGAQYRILGQIDENEAKKAQR
jgi:hypothetical protein